MRTVSLQPSDTTIMFPPVSVLGFGCSAILGRAGRRESLAALATAYDAGINFYDTARSYGYGAGESLLGDFFAGNKRSSVILCTKFGILPSESKSWKQHLKPLVRPVVRLFPGLRTAVRKHASDQMVANVFSVEILRSSLETSLRELKTDYVDLLLMHAAPMSVLQQQDLLEEMGRIVQAGKVRVAGISGDQDVIEAVFSHPIPVLRSAQFAVNIFKLGLLNHAKQAAESMFLVANQPFGGVDAAVQCQQRIQEIKASPALTSELREKLDLGDELLLPEIVLNTILTGTGISVVIPAMMRRNHLENNVRAVERCRFTASELALIRSLLQTLPSNRISS